MEGSSSSESRDFSSSHGGRGRAESWPENTHSKKKLHFDTVPKGEYWQKPQDFVFPAATEMKWISFLIRSHETNQRQADGQILTRGAPRHPAAVQRGQLEAQAATKYRRRCTGDIFNPDPGRYIKESSCAEDFKS